MSCCSKYSLFFRFSYQNFVCISIPYHACHVLCSYSSISPWDLYNENKLWSF
jgi:hypothetical protein